MFILPRNTRGAMKKIAEEAWEVWNLFKEIYEQHHFAVWCWLVVPATISGVWARLDRFNGLAIFLICLMALALTAVALAAFVAAKNWSRHQTPPDVTLAETSIIEPPPQPELSPQLTYLTPYEAIHYLADESQWAEEKAGEVSPNGMAYNVMLEAPQEFQERAAEGRIRVYGFDDDTHRHEEIGKTHWMSFGLEYSKVYKPDGDVRTVPTTFDSAFYNKNGKYSDLRIVADDVYRTWPRSEEAEMRAEFSLIKMTREDAIATLWKLRKVGVAIRNVHFSSEEQFPEWKANYEKWRSDVLAVADKFDEGLRPRLEVLDRLRPPPKVPAVNKEHALLIGIASEILLRLEEQLP